MNHKLALEIPDTINTKILRIEDYSDYNEMVPVKCPILEITAPGFIEPAVVDTVNVGFSLNLSACDLGLQLYDCDTNPLCLPDGIYVIKYAVSPRDKVYCEYNHLRTSMINKSIKEALCSLNLCATEPSEETEEKIKKIQDAMLYVQAAKAKVEVCGDPDKGMELYNYAKKLLSSFDCQTC